MDGAEITSPSTDNADDRTKHGKRRTIISAAAALVAVAAVVVGTLWWLQARNFATTDDAFIDARIISISPQVAGTVTLLGVTDNQHVAAGMMIATLDDTIYRAQLGQEQAQVAQAKAQIASLDAEIDQQQARIAQATQQVQDAQDAAAFSQSQSSRQTTLEGSGFGTVESAQQATSTLAENEASLAAARSNVLALQKGLAALQAQRQAAQASSQAAVASEQVAEANLKYTKIVAPVDGRVTKLGGGKGTFLQPGQSLTMFVPDEIWVTANFKETQLAAIKPGQIVDITIDAYPDLAFTGHVVSQQSGSGTAFSLLPAQNATGNYVKVVQRVPVKIVFDEIPAVQVGPGMSVSPSVRLR